MRRYDHEADSGRYSERLARHAYEEDLDRSLDLGAVEETSKVVRCPVCRVSMLEVFWAPYDGATDPERILEIAAAGDSHFCECRRSGIVDINEYRRAVLQQARDAERMVREYNSNGLRATHRPTELYGRNRKGA